MCVGVVLCYTFHRQDKTIPHNREVWKLEKGIGFVARKDNRGRNLRPGNPSVRMDSICTGTKMNGPADA